MSLKLEPKKLRTDSSFLERAISVYGSYFKGELIVEKSTLATLTSIFVHLLTKVKPNEVEPTVDITKFKQLLFCSIKLAEQDSDPETLPNELVMIGFLIKNNFDSVSVDFQTDQDILELCVREVQAARNPGCFGNALTILGTLASQAILTLNNSEEFFVKVEQQKILAAIAHAYEPTPSRRIVLECIEKFIRSNQCPITLTKNQKPLKKVFESLKAQAANTLLERYFASHNPIVIYRDIGQV
jgi:hypothetical protein